MQMARVSSIGKNMQKVFERGAKNAIPYRKFGKTGWNVSALGLGCAPLGDVYGNLPHQDRLDIVKHAFDVGINLLDTSPYYGETKSESNLGQCLNELSKNSDKLYDRDQYILCTKVGRYAFGKHDYSANRIEQSIQHSMERLQTDYIDCINIHDFEFVGFYPDNLNGSLDQIVEETLPALEEQKNKGIIGAYGLGARPLVVIDYVGRRYGWDKISTLLTYNHYNLTDERLMNYMPRLKQYEIGIMQGGVTLMGLLTPQGPQTWNSAPPIIKERCREAVKIVKERTEGNDLEKEKAILRLSFLHCMDNINIHSCLVGPTSSEQLANNVRWIKEEQIDYIYGGEYLTEKDKELIEYLQSGVFADIMNLGWIEDGSQYNICEATFESTHWKDVLHYADPH